MEPHRGDGLPWLTVLVVFTVFGLLSTLGIVSMQRLEQQPVTLGPTVATAMSTWWFWGLAAQPVFRLSQRFPLAAAGWRRSWAVHGLVAVSLVVIQAVITVATYRALSPGSFGGQPWTFWLLSYLTNRGLGGLLIYGALVGLAHTIDARARLRRRELDSVRLEAELARAQLNALQLQLQPHFLFNTLHAIGVLNQEDPAKATRMIAALGDLLRGSLATRSTQEIPLEQELVLLGSYLEIESIRFSDRLTVSVDVEPTLGRHLVPTFLFQPLVENAVRHGVAVNPGSTRIRISAAKAGSDLALSVWNDGAPLTGDTREGVGLATTRNRLQGLYGKAGRLELANRNGGVEAVVHLPIHDHPVL